jgi:hypothetical protein
MHPVPSSRWVPLGALGIAIFFSFLGGPGARAALRLPQASSTGSCVTRIRIPEIDTWLPRGDAGGDERLKGNALLVQVRWDPVDGSDGSSRKFKVQLQNPVPLRGSCGNKGKDSFPDYTLEQADNDPIWKIDEGIVPYAGVQNTVAETRSAYPPGEWVGIYVRSYDFGAWTRIQAEAVGCPPVTERIPKDSDSDTLPDAWERGKSFFDDAGNVVDFDIGSPTSHGEELDAFNDRDGGFEIDPAPGAAQPLLSRKVHAEPGDGFNAFAEYRGLFVQGVFHRLDELVNDGGEELPASDRGPKLKDVFIFDPDALVSDAGRALRTHGISYHRILQEEMGPAADAAGVVAFNDAEPLQHAVWIRSASLTEAGRLGRSNGHSVNGTPAPIDIDSDDIRSDADDIRVIPGDITHLYEELRDWVVAHEIGHKLSLRHPLLDLALGVLPDPPTYDERLVWTEQVGQEDVVASWSVVLRYKHRGRPGEDPRYLLLSRIFTQAGTVRRAGIGTQESTTQIHDRAHTCRSRFIVFRGPAPAGPILERHTGSLMDWTHEHTDLTPRLPSDERLKLKIKP